VLTLPPGYAPYGRVVVPRPEALDLVKYLQALNHTYPVLPPLPTPAPDVKVQPRAEAAAPKS
jgi:cytochrome c oxidase cbb3-type subunit 2